MTLQVVDAALNDCHAQTNRGLGGHSMHELSHYRDGAEGKVRSSLSTLKWVEILESLMAEMPEILFEYFSIDHRCTHSSPTLQPTCAEDHQGEA
jgi:hypothetical protein